MASLHVADDFGNIYNNEWREARQSLSNGKHEEEIIYLLMQLVRGIYDFCLDQSKKSHQHLKKKEDLTEEYIHHKLPTSFHKDHVTNPVRSFIHRCVECLHQMCCVKKSPLYIYWIPKGDVIDKGKFNIQGDKEDHVCDWTVWPAVLSEDGTVLRKGVIIPV